MPAKKKAATAETAVETAPVISDEELLKQKKEEAKQKKEAEKSEKKVARETKKHAKVEAAKGPQKRNPLKAHGKKYRTALEKIEKNKLYTIAEAVALAKNTSTTKFDASVEVHTRLGIDTAKSDQAVRATVALPHGTGKTVRVVAFVDDDKAADAKKHGAVEAGDVDLIEKVAKGWLDFDVAIATPAMMKKIGKIARILGQQGLMPNPKAGTVTEDIAATIAEIKKGKVEFRNDKTGILHNVIGKVSFTEDKLSENLKTYLRAVNDMKPKSVKGAFVISLTLATSMGPAVKLDVGEALRSI